jgi:hypothetical protein
MSRIGIDAESRSGRGFPAFIAICNEVREGAENSVFFVKIHRNRSILKRFPVNQLAISSGCRFLPLVVLRTRDAIEILGQRVEFLGDPLTGHRQAMSGGERRRFQDCKFPN